MLTHRYAPVIWLAVYLGLQIAAPFLRLPSRSLWVLLSAVLLSAVLFTFVSLAVYGSLTHAVRRPGAAALCLGLGAAGWAGVYLLGPAPPNPPNLLKSFGLPAALALHTGDELFRIVAALGLGVLLANALREPNILLPAAVFAAFADYFMVHFGTVHHALKSEGGQQLVHAVSAKVPTLPGLPALTVGPADFVFMAFFFACVYRFDLHLMRTFWALFVLVSLSLAFVALRSAPIPALAPMALAFVGANFRRFKLSRPELQAMGAAAAIVLVVALGFIFWGK